MARRTRAGLVLGLVVAAAFAAPTLAPAAATDPPPLQVLSPGFVGHVAEVMPLNVVFVGYDEGSGVRDISAERFLDGQAELTAGIARYPLLFGRLLPTYTAMFPDYRLRFADQAFEDAFFGHLLAIGEPAPLTRYQSAYNQQPGGSLTIDESLTIDGPSVEAWLGDNAGPLLGVDTTQPTVFFVNWFGRPDFAFHVFSKTGEPDTDTGRQPGLNDSRKLIAWGGSPAPAGEPARRVWFHDLSAGPEFNTQNWDLGTADVDGDGLADYRMPPVWEYGSTSGYRPFDDLTGDLAKILRYVFVDMILAPSPIYPPTISPPLVPDDIGIDLTRIVAPGITPTALNKPVLAGRVTELQPWNTFRVSEQRIPYEGRIQEVNRCWGTGWADFSGTGESCFGKRGGGYAYYDMFIHVIDHLPQFTRTDSEHSIPTLLFEVPDEEANCCVRALAEPNFKTGDQFDIVSFQTPRAEAAGFGQTDTMVHEVGHHVGLSHVHDGIDFERGIDFFAGGEFFFAWTGDESATVMSYLDLDHDFGRFERDSMGRWMTSAYLNQSNQVLSRLLASPRASRVSSAIVTADQDALAALIAIDARWYAAAAAHAKRAYDGLLRAAASIGVVIEPEARAADIKSWGRSDLFVDPIPPIDGERPASSAPKVRKVNLDGVPLPARPTG